MRLMIAIDSYRMSGPAKGVLDFCEAVRMHVDPIVVVFQRGRGVPTEVQEECRRRGVPIEVVAERRRYDPSLLSRTLHLARSLRPALVQTHGYKANVVGLAVRKRLGVPWVAFSHGPTCGGLKMRLYLAADALIIRRADRVVAVSAARKAHLERSGCTPDRVVTIHNAVDMPGRVPVDAASVRRALGLPVDRPVIAVVGRLSREKGQVYFVQAMAEVVQAVPGATGLIVGDGPDERLLRARVAALGLQDVIHFAGYRRDMPQIYPAIDVLVLPSLSEGLPNVVLEAMAHARPVIATRVGGVPEVIEDGVTGVLVPPEDVHALSRASVKLLRLPMRRESMGRAARERVDREFCVRARAERILSVYREVVQ